MASKLKREIKQLLVVNSEKKYKKLLKSKKTDYNTWIREEEERSELQKPIRKTMQKCLTNGTANSGNEKEKIQNDGKLANLNSLCKFISILENEIEVNEAPQYLVCSPEILPQVIEEIRNPENRIAGVILQNQDGKFQPFAFSRLHESFTENKSIMIIYSDEDVVDDADLRIDPWFKPDWSPDTFLDTFYFGSFAALRKDALLRAYETMDDAGKTDAYRLCLSVLTDAGAFEKHGGLKKEKKGQDGAVCHIPEVLFSGYRHGYDVIKEWHLPDPAISCENGGKENLADDTLVSVIIPSKDHPDILFRCIRTLNEVTAFPEGVSFEIIVVDNGSSPENKEMTASRLSAMGALYLYKKEEFNFSRMCNTGAAAAKGEYLLFLNDDMEIVCEDWLSKMLTSARIPYAGAVGCKLLYPGTDKIQHAGITNLRIGPAHKLQFLSDSEDHYFGKNRGVHDMIGVTGACLLIRKSVFEETGGFCEDLRVAFNDVDLCFRIWEAGYYNIERNDTFLYHHESLSRGNDSEDTEKQKRLNREKDLLYEKHQPLYGWDPFYNIHLTTDRLETGYRPAFHYQIHLDADWARVSDITPVVNNTRLDKCVWVGMEGATDIFKWKHGVSREKYPEALNQDLGFYFRGYTFVTGSNNACYEKMLLLKNTATERVYGIETESEYRADIADNVPDQENVELSGFFAKMRPDAVPSGTYRFGMYMKDRTSKLRLYNWSSWTLEV